MGLSYTPKPQAILDAELDSDIKTSWTLMETYSTM